ncbi:MAG: AtpZ/AtpI family protein [Tissierellaceae bacterium]
MTRQNKDDKESQKKKTFHNLSYFPQVGFTISAMVIIGVIIGKYLDRALGTRRWLLLVFSLLGVLSVMKFLFEISKDK